MYKDTGIYFSLANLTAYSTIIFITRSGKIISLTHIVCLKLEFKFNCLYVASGIILTIFNIVNPPPQECLLEWQKIRKSNLEYP